MKISPIIFSILIFLSILSSCNSKKETPLPQTDIIAETQIVETEQASPEQNWKESLLSENNISTQEDIESIKQIIEKAVENNTLEELQTFLETEAKKEKVPPQILFGLSLVYGRKGLVKDEYKAIEKLEEQVKQRPGIAFNLSLVYGRKETLKSQIDKAEAEALALLQGFISVTSEPKGANVFLDGEFKGTTPYTTEGLGEGSYAVEIWMKDYTTVKRTISVKAGKTTAIVEELVLLPGSLVINSDPVGSTVLMNGEEIGITPLKISKIEAGKYELTISKEKFGKKLIPVNIEPGIITTIDTSLEILTGILSINDLTDGALIYLDGERVFPSNSTTMQRKVLKNITVGKHELTIKKNNFKEKNIVVVINSGQLTMTSGILEQDIMEIPFANIKVDGKLADWTGIEPIIIDPVNDDIGDEQGTDIRFIYMARDDKYLYIRFDLAAYERTFNYNHHISLSPVEGGPVVMLISFNGGREAQILEYLEGKDPNTKKLGTGTIKRYGNFYEARYSLNIIKKKISTGTNVLVQGYSTRRFSNDTIINFDTIEDIICYFY